MAKRRMISNDIVDSDAFLDMPISSQLLYFHLNVRADDDGFINNPKKIMRIVGCADDDMKVLIGKKFIIPFESGVVVIKHWKIHNYIRKDRYSESNYTEEKALLTVDTNGSYTLGRPNVNQMSTVGQPLGDVGKVRLGKVSIVKDIVEYLNHVSGKNYKSDTSKTIKCINARVNEGFTLDDFKRVIDIKVKEWKGTDYEKFLRPETLFGTKFEGYLNQAPSQEVKEVDLDINSKASEILERIKE